MKKSLFIIPLMLITLSCSYLPIYKTAINNTNISSPQTKVPIKWWQN